MSLLRRKPDTDATETASATTDPKGIGGLQTSFSRLVATGGIIGAGTGIAAVMGSQDVAAWIIGIVVAGASVLLAAIVWSSRSL